MPIVNGWIVRALAVRLRQPGMKMQRRFTLIVALILAVFVAGALVYLARQPTEDALENAALKVFAAMGVLIAILITVAVLVRKRTGAAWTTQEALEMAGERRQTSRTKRL